jgi:phosphoesterase RecJ-like protein
MVARLIVTLHAALTPDVATCLLAGLLADTLGFRTSNTTIQVLETAIQMMRAGASLPDLTDKIFNHRPLGVIRMWSSALEDLHLEDGLLWSQVTQAMRQRIGYDDNGDAGLVSFLNTVDEADIAVVFDELPDGRVNVSIRAVPEYDISQVALSLGGGGHPQAAGCTLDGPLEEARAKVLSRLAQARDEQIASR